MSQADASPILVPAELLRLRTRPLLAIRFDVDGPTTVGRSPAGDRRVGVITGGRFDSDRPGLSGQVLSGGSDWQTVRSDGAWTLDVRAVLETFAGDLICMTYHGLRHGPPEVIARLLDGKPTDPHEYYFRATPTFETAAPHLDWLNRVVAVSAGHRLSNGPVYQVHEVL